MATKAEIEAAKAEWRRLSAEAEQARDRWQALVANSSPFVVGDIIEDREPYRVRRGQPLAKRVLIVRRLTSIYGDPGVFASLRLKSGKWGELVKSYRVFDYDGVKPLFEKVGHEEAAQ